MKKKERKKLAKLICLEVNRMESKSKISESINYHPYDAEVSKKMKNLILNLVKYKDRVSINIYEESITIATSDITQIKKSPRLGQNSAYSEDKFLEISINKQGFILNQGYVTRTNFRDENIFTEMKPVLEKRAIEINNENFNEIWEKILLESGIIRDNNLEQLFNE